MPRITLQGETLFVTDTLHRHLILKRPQTNLMIVAQISQHVRRTVKSIPSARFQHPL